MDEDARWLSANVNEYLDGNRRVKKDMLENAAKKAAAELERLKRDELNTQVGV